MAIPRLDPAANPYELNVTINVRLLPYFQQWYQRNKLPTDTPEIFAMRVLKSAVRENYIQEFISAEVAAAEQAKIDAMEILSNDIESLGTELS